MNKRSIPMAIVGFVLALAGIAGYFMPAPTEATPSRLLMENSGGRVVFTHDAHSKPGGPYGETACLDCHHELKISTRNIKKDETPEVMKCAACHSSADDPDFAARHQGWYAQNGGDPACARCHHAAFNGYSALWKHDEHIDYAGEDCAGCHHIGATTSSGREMKNIRPQRCANCHTAKPNPMTPTVIRDAGHKTCVSCHSDWLESGAAGCKTCHNAQGTADLMARGEKIPGFSSCSTCHNPMPGKMDALHGNCMGCHDKAGKGPGKAAPCAQCHAKV